MSNLVMYLVANKGLGMSGGKLAAQAAHAAVRAALLSLDCDNGNPKRATEWLDQGETKIVLEARDTEHLLSVREYIERAGFKTHLVIDEGRTEVPSHSPTVLGVEVLDKDDEKVKFTFSSFKLYKDPKPDPPQRKGRSFMPPWHGA
jgi:PTH2 family peptidyl-tRNA hydrolase